MWPQDDEHDVLLIDRAAAAHVPQDSDVREWALDKRVFISSVMAELGEERAAAANGVRSLGARPVMFEEFGGRDADPLDAYLGEVETSQIYVGILGQSYGRPLPTRFSATHTEFRHAEQQGLRMAVWALATQHREEPRRKGKVQLIDARRFYVKMPKSLGNKRNKIGDPTDRPSEPDQIGEVTRIFGNFKIR